MSLNLFRVCALALSLVLAPVVHAASVQSVRLWRAPDHTRLVLDLSGPVSHKIIALFGPDRLVIDIPRASLETSLAADLADTGIRRLRSGVRNGNDLRIVLDLDRPLKPRSFALPRGGGKPDRLVVDLYAESKPRARVGPPAAGARRDIIVAIDAGHGGEDPGAIGPRGEREKVVVLAIAKQLHDRLQRAPGFASMMVRRGDYYVGLQARREIARGRKADLFVSIHADAFTNKQVSGGSVYALSQRGATSTTARFLAMKENMADQIGGVRLLDKDQILASVLLDLSMTANLDESLAVGGHVLDALGSAVSLHKRGVEQANFAVLRSPDIPSILVETGFISNPAESRKLASRSHQARLAGALFEGVVDYFESNPPEGSLIAWRQQRGGAAYRQYVVNSGDTLSEIAERYDITIGSLRRHNRLSGNTIRVGQKLAIPAS